MSATPGPGVLSAPRPSRCKRAWIPFFVLVVLVAVQECSARTGQTHPLIRDFIGINGHTVQFKPALYQPVCRLVRDYHPVSWDLDNKTQELPRFPLAKNGVDWSQVYGSWRAKGWNIDACLMFETIKRTDWSNLESDLEAYGQSFAREFGPSGPRRLVDSVELGNEPGKWSDHDYRVAFKALAQGLRAGDPKLQIVTCNVTAAQSGEYEKSAACLEGLSALFDVLSVHTYAQLENWPTWRRSFPEDPKLPRYLQDIQALCRWRDAHAPGKPVWVTEFGYDSSTRTPEASGDFSKWVGVTDRQQAQWLVRSLLVFSAMPVERAYIYFFNDEDQPRLHASSGITRHFKPKPSFYALEHLQRVLGDFRFERMITNAPAGVRVQQYRSDSGRIRWAVWSPTGAGKSLSVLFENLPGRVAGIQRMPLTQEEFSAQDSPGRITQGHLELTIDESPTYLLFGQR